MLIEKLLKFLFNLMPGEPNQSDLSLAEIFRSPMYLNAPKNIQEEIQIKSAQYRFEYEKELSYFENYFKNVEVESYLKRKIVLDLGCFTGGRSTYWAQQYNLKMLFGIDIDKAYIESANKFAQKMKVNGYFLTALGEYLPFSNNSFDSIITYDVFEHVSDVERVMSECWRVLKTDGLIWVVFPQFKQPFESHLGFVTKTPCLHWFFSSKQISKIYFKILEERSKKAEWYKDYTAEKLAKFPHINGTTALQFGKIIKKLNWKIIIQNKFPLFQTGRKSKKRLFRIIRIPIWILAQIPYLDEFFMDRVVYLLQKKI